MQNKKQNILYTRCATAEAKDKLTWLRVNDRKSVAIINERQNVLKEHVRHNIIFDQIEENHNSITSTIRHVTGHAHTQTQSEQSSEREREMFYLTTHSTHFIYGYMAPDHSDSEKGNLQPPHRLLLSINSKGSFICTIPQTG